MQRRTPVLIVLSITVLVLAASLIAPVSRGQGSGGDSPNQMYFLEVMDRYLEISERWVAMAQGSESATYLAIEGIAEIYENRGQRDQAISHLQRVLKETPDDPALRNLVRFKIRDLYNESGQSDNALAELDRIIQENR